MLPQFLECMNHHNQSLVQLLNKKQLKSLQDICEEG